MSEIEPFPRAVLAQRFPCVPIHGDFTTIQAGDYESIDLLVGGTPCQSFSVAGLRGGLADERGNLALEYLRLADRLRPRWLVWENVPGVLSSSGGRDFGAFLGALGQLGYGFAYRVLDAQFFGVAQRRRRVFVVGYLGDWRRAAAVLFEPASLRGHPAPRREAGERVPDSLTVGANQCAGFPGDFVEADLARCVTTGEGRRQDYETTTLVTGALCNNGKAAGSATQQDAEQGMLVVSPSLRAQSQASHRLDSEAYVAHTLRGEGFDASEDGSGRGTPLVPVTFPWQIGSAMQMPHELDLCGTLVKNQTQAVAFGLAQITSAANRPRAEAGLPASAMAKGSAIHVAFDAYNQAWSDVAHTLRRGSGAAGDAVPQTLSASAVRRLTPRECERLQGFPDDWTLVQYRNKPAADGPRYNAIGNSMAVPVLRWIGERIQKQGAQA